MSPYRALTVRMSEKIEAEASDDSNRRDSSSEGETKAADVPKPTVEKQDGSVEENANETEEERVDVVENEDENAARVAAKPEKAKSDDENEETERPGDDVSNGGGDDDEPSRRDALEPRLDENRPEEKNAASPVADSDSKPSEGRDTRSPSDHDEQPTATSQVSYHGNKLTFYSIDLLLEWRWQIPVGRSCSSR